MLGEQSLSQVIKRLSPYSTCDVADALSRLNHRRGGFLPGISLHSPSFQSGDTKIIGPAHTVKFELNREKGARPSVRGHYIDHTPPGCVLLLAGPRGVANAIYGGIMTARAAKLGAVGTVISGRLRDIQEHRDAAFPVFARGVGTTAGGGVCFASTIGEPVALQTSIEGVEHESTVHPGDVIVGDANGVVCVPIELAEEVAELVPALAKVDAECLNDVKGGMTVTETFERRRGRLSC